VIRGTASGGGCVSPATPTVAGIVYGKTANACGGAFIFGGQIALGNYAGQTSQLDTAIAIGVYAGSSSQGCNAIAIGTRTAMCSQPSGSIAIGACTTASGASRLHIGPIRSATGPFTLKYCPCTREITYD
jgi:hypothetical protein